METGAFPTEACVSHLRISMADFSCDTHKWCELTSEHTTVSVSTAHLLSSSGFLIEFYESVCLKSLCIFFPSLEQGEEWNTGTFNVSVFFCLCLMSSSRLGALWGLKYHLLISCLSYSPKAASRSSRRSQAAHFSCHIPAGHLHQQFTSQSPGFRLCQKGS